MSFLVGEISARVSADTSRFDSSISGVKRKGEQASRSVTQSFDKVGRSMRRVGATMTASLTLPMVMGMRQAVRESALLEGALAKFDVVFGDMAEETRAWVDEFREGVPLSRREIVQSAAAMQDLLVPMGIAREEATGMTQEWMQLAAALSAFNDVPVDQALEAIRSGIAGQSRPLRQFGIDVRETALQQRALEMGLISAGEAMSDQVRQQALLAQAYANSSDAVAGYEDQLGTTLMVQQELGATWKDTLALIGQDLQPMYTSLMGSVTDLLNAFQGLDDEQRQTIIRWGLMVAAAGPVIGVLGQLLIWTNRLKVAMVALGASMKAVPWVAVASGVIYLGNQVRKVIRDTREFNSVLEEALAMTDAEGTVEEFEAIERAIDAVNEKLKFYELQLQALGEDPHVRDQIEQLEEQRRALIANGIAISEKIDAQHEASQADRDASDAAEQAAGSVNAYADALSRIKPIVDNIPPVDDIIDPLHEAEIRKLREEYQQFNNALDETLRWSLELAPAIEEVGDKTEESQRKGMLFGDTMANALSQAALHGRDLSSVLDGLLKQLGSRVFLTGIRFLLGFGTGGLGGFIGNVLGFADGGNPPTGRASIVGERGPELIVPRSASTIIPNHQLSSSGKAVIHLTSVAQIDRRTVWEAVNRYEEDL